MKTCKTMLILLTLCVAANVSAAEVSKVTLSYENGAIVARIDVQGPFQFTHQTEVPKNGKPDRLILDVVGATNSLANSFAGLPDCQIKGIRTSQYAVTPEKVVRIVFDLTKAPIYQVTSESNWIKVSFEDKGLSPFASWNSGAPVPKASANPAKPAEKPAVPLATAGVQATKGSTDAAKANQSIEQDRMTSLAGTAKPTVRADEKAPAATAVAVKSTPSTGETSAKSSAPKMPVSAPVNSGEKAAAKTPASAITKTATVTMSTPIPQTTTSVKSASPAETKSSSEVKPSPQTAVPNTTPTGAKPAIVQKPTDNKTTVSSALGKSLEPSAQTSVKTSPVNTPTTVSPNAVPPTASDQKTESKAAPTSAETAAAKTVEPPKATPSNNAGPQNATPEVKWVSPTGQTKSVTATKSSPTVSSPLVPTTTEPAKEAPSSPAPAPIQTKSSDTKSAQSPAPSTTIITDQASIAQLNAQPATTQKPAEQANAAKTSETIKPTASPVSASSTPSPAAKVSTESTATVKSSATAPTTSQPANSSAAATPKPLPANPNKSGTESMPTPGGPMPTIPIPFLQLVPKAADKSVAAEPVTPAKKDEPKVIELNRADSNQASSQVPAKDQSAQASLLPGPVSAPAQVADVDNQGTNQPEDAGRPTARFRRTPLSAAKIKGTLVAEFPQRLVIKYEDLGNRDPFATLIDETRTNDHPNEQRIPNIEGLKLVGIIVSPTGDNRALFADKAGFSYMMQSGDKVQRGYVLRVESDKVYFQIFEYGWSRTVALTIENAE